MKRMKIVIPTMIAVGIIALWMLEKDYSAVPLQYRIPIALMGAIISGVITFFLYKNDEDGVDKKSGKG
jgi:RsiW-degrading membrane proteinase PrsW (M82 family)